MRTRDVSALVPLLSENKVLKELDISKSVISKKNMTHLWLSLHVNISVTKLTYSRLNFLALDEQVAIDAELSLNMIIRDQIMPKVSIKQKKLNTHIRELSLRGIRIPTATNPAIIKFIKV